jgi:hypothetical protein
MYMQEIREIKTETNLKQPADVKPRVALALKD